jgi:hypothetical protein
VAARLAAAFTTCQIALGVIASLTQTTYSSEDHATMDASCGGPLIL